MRLLLVFGTRPEAIKLAPVIQACRARGGVEAIVAVTGQHREMLDQALAAFGITPDFDLRIMRPRQELAQVTCAVLEGIQALIRKTAPDWVIVQGDTTSAFAGALAAFYERVPVAHVEAGLRTGNILSPWPEEMNRKLVGQLASLHFAPTPRAAANLRAEGVPDAQIMVSGNTVIDAVQWVAAKGATAGDDRCLEAALGRLPDPSRRLILVTGHRRENFDGGLDRICVALARLAERPDVEIIYPVHLNPVVREAASRHLTGFANVHLVEPLDYLPFVALMARATLIVTDSGGIQEEAPGLGKPVLVTRDTTERPEAIEAGTARLVGTDGETLYRAAWELLENESAYAAMATATNPFGDGRAAQRILERIAG